MYFESRAPVVISAETAMFNAAGPRLRRARQPAHSAPTVKKAACTSVATCLPWARMVGWNAASPRARSPTRGPIHSAAQA